MAVYAVALVLGAAALVRNIAIRANFRRFATLIVLALFFAPTFLYEERISAFSTFALAHALQYFMFMYYVGAHRANGDGHGRFIKLLVTFFVATGFFMLLKDGAIWGRASWPLLGIFWGIVLSHFVVDADVWRLSQPFQRNYIRSAFGFLFSK
jgi:hypothetical protein